MEWRSVLDSPPRRPLRSEAFIASPSTTRTEPSSYGGRAGTSALALRTRLDLNSATSSVAYPPDYVTQRQQRLQTTGTSTSTSPSASYRSHRAPIDRGLRSYVDARTARFPPPLSSPPSFPPLASSSRQNATSSRSLAAQRARARSAALSPRTGWAASSAAYGAGRPRTAYTFRYRPSYSRLAASRRPHHVAAAARRGSGRAAGAGGRGTDLSPIAKWAKEFEQVASSFGTSALVASSPSRITTAHWETANPSSLLPLEEPSKYASHLESFNYRLGSSMSLLSPPPSSAPARGATSDQGRVLNHSFDAANLPVSPPRPLYNPYWPRRTPP